MGAHVALANAVLEVTPGGETTLAVTVTNTGRVVDAFDVEVLGPPALWSRCEPAGISLFPGQSGTVLVTFAPPVGSSVPAGPLGYGVHARSHEDPQGSVVEEGGLDVARQPQLAAEISPRTGKARGRRASRHNVAIDNVGNTPLTVALIGVDDSEEVDVDFSPSQLQIAPGTAAFVKVRARAARPFWRGPNQTRPFLVETRTEDCPPTRLHGTLLNEPRLPGWLPKAVLLAAVAACALAVAWFGLFKPAIKDTATDAANSALVAAGISPAPSGASAGNGAGKAGGGAKSGGGAPKASAPTTSAPATSAAPATGSATAPPTPAPTPVAIAATVPSQPFALQLTMAKPLLVVDNKHQVSVTDLVFQNPAADKGQLIVTDDGATIFTIALETFPDYDLHFVTPIVVSPTGTLAMQVNCANPAPTKCTPSTLVVGTSQSVVTP